MTLTLQSRLIADFKTRSRPPESAEADDGILEVRWLDPPPEPESPATMDRLKGAVRRAAEAASCDVETTERLVREAAERFEHDDIHPLMSRPFDEIVDMICRELGLKPPASSPVNGSDRVRRPGGPEGAFSRINGGDGGPLRSP